MKELNKNSSKEEIYAYINSIVERDKKNALRVGTVPQSKGVTTIHNKMQEKSADNQTVEFDALKTKVLKYIMYKKRTENEVKQKFSSSAIDQNLLENVIENLKENGYINDENYIQRAVNEFLAINTLSLKEIRNKLYAKGIERDIIDTYFSNHAEELEEYEIACAKKLVNKKKTQMEQPEMENFLYRKGYTRESIRLAFEEDG